MFIRRVAESTSIFTKGKLYKLLSGENVGEKFKILNDKGNTSQPAADIPKYWTFVNDSEVEVVMGKYKLELDVREAAQHHILDRSTRQCGKTASYKFKQPINHSQQEIIKMLKIEQVTLINDTDVKELNVGNLIHHIKNEEKKLESLEAIKSESKAIARIREEHRANILKLTEILDSME